LNTAEAVASRTIRDEVLQAIEDSDGQGFQLSQTPVVPGSVVIEVEESAVFEESSSLELEFLEPELFVHRSGDEAQSGTTWKEVNDLTEHGPDDRVFTLDSTTGVLSFGNGLNGKAVPPGFRNVVATRYSSGGGDVGEMEIGDVATLLSSVPFLTGATNEQRSTGGTNSESRLSAMRRGPQEIRARGRAVTTDDYALMALRTPGAKIARAHAVDGYDPRFPGAPIPGTVGVLIITPPQPDGAPMPDEAMLRAVAEFLSGQVAPAGVEVVAGAPEFQGIRSEVSIVVTPGADVGSTIRGVLAELDKYFDPLLGGDSGDGWPFGGKIRYTALLRTLVRIPGVAAVPRVNLVLDGFRDPSCSDVAIRNNALLWPGGHQVIPVEEGEL